MKMYVSRLFNTGLATAIVLAVLFAALPVSAFEGGALREIHIPVDAPDGIVWIDNTSDGFAIRAQSDAGTALQVAGSVVIDRRGGEGHALSVYSDGDGAERGIRFDGMGGDSFRIYGAADSYAVHLARGYWPEHGITMTNDGNIGIRVTEPQVSLHVKDVLRLEPQSTAPAGAMGDLYVSDYGALYFHDGTGWNEVALN